MESPAGKRQKTAAVPCTLLELPRELLLSILEYLDDDSLIGPRRVCWQLYALCRAVALQRKQVRITANKEVLRHFLHATHVSVKVGAGTPVPRYSFFKLLSSSRVQTLCLEVEDRYHNLYLEKSLYRRAQCPVFSGVTRLESSCWHNTCPCKLLLFSAGGLPMAFPRVQEVVWTGIQIGMHTSECVFIHFLKQKWNQLQLLQLGAENSLLERRERAPYRGSDVIWRLFSSDGVYHQPLPEQIDEYTYYSCACWTCVGLSCSPELHTLKLLLSDSSGAFFDYLVGLLLPTAAPALRHLEFQTELIHLFTWQVPPLEEERQLLCTNSMNQLRQLSQVTTLITHLTDVGELLHALTDLPGSQCFLRCLATLSPGFRTAWKPVFHCRQEYVQDCLQVIQLLQQAGVAASLGPFCT